MSWILRNPGCNPQATLPSREGRRFTPANPKGDYDDIERYSVPWHKIEAAPGEYDFSWIDGPMCQMRRLGMVPIVAPLHHTLFPDWLTGGFANSHLPAACSAFVQRFAERYDWVPTTPSATSPCPRHSFAP